MKRIGRVILVEKAVPPILTQAHRDPKAAHRGLGRRWAIAFLAQIIALYL
jgi:hypothetical protein